MWYYDSVGVNKRKCDIVVDWSGAFCGKCALNDIHMFSHYDCSKHSPSLSFRVIFIAYKSPMNMVDQCPLCCE